MTGIPTPIATLLGSLRIGEPRPAGPLALAPVFGGLPAPAYLLGAQAIAQGLVHVDELDGGNVPSLVVHNAADLPVLFLDGEHLVGGMQNRVLNTTVLLAAHSRTVVPVSCVEAHRWSYGTQHAMRPDADMAYPRLRQSKAERVVENERLGRGALADQQEVWLDIEAKRREAGAGASASGAMQDIFDQRRARLEELLAPFPNPLERQTGVIAFVAGHPVVADLFDEPRTLRALWSRLVSGYALEALGRRARTPDVFSARGFLAEVIAEGHEVTVHDGIGIGEDVAVTTDRALAHGLLWEDRIVHLAVFTRVRSGGRRSGKTGSASVAPPGRGAQRGWFGRDSVDPDPVRRQP